MPDQTRVAETVTETTDQSDQSPGASESVDADPTAEDTETDADETPDRFPKLDDAAYDRADEFLDRYVRFTAREWAVAVLCADFRTGTGVEMQRVGERLPDMVPFVAEPYTRQEVYQARRSFEAKVREAAATFLYGAFSGLLTADEVDEITYDATEVAKFLLEVEGSSLSHDEERTVEDRVRRAMHDVHEASAEVRYDRCPECGAEFDDEAS